MKLILKFSLLFISLTSLLQANEEAAHHSPSIGDLKYPFINFIILLAILSKVIKPLKDKFEKNSDDIKSLVNSAAKNNKDAEERLAKYTDKIKNLDSDLVKINTEYETEAAQFAKLHSEETQTIISRMKRDLENKLMGEKKELVEAMNHELLETVIKKTQVAIGGNPEFKSKATNKIISELKN